MMATTIGRVEFLVGLDGKGLPAQARRLASQIAAAGKDAGDNFGVNFEKSFSARLDGLAGELSNRMSREGTLAGERFSDTFQRRIKSSFAGIQGELADALINEEAFRRFAAQFDEPSQAADRLREHIAQLRTEQVKMAEEVQRGDTTYTRYVRRLVLTKEEAAKLEKTISQYADTLTREQEATRQAAEVEAEHHRRLEVIEGDYTRLGRLVGDTDAFKKFADQVGGSDEAFRRLRVQIDDLGTALGKSSSEIETFQDRLERTKSTVDTAAERLDGYNERVREVGVEHDNVSKKLDKIGKTMRSSWRRMDGTVKLVIASIVGAGDQAAVLGSALGAGLIGVGSAAAQAVAGLGGVVAVFSTLAKDLDELPPSLRDVKQEFTGFTDALKATRDIISAAAFREMDGVFDTLSATVGELGPDFEELGTTVGEVFADFARNTRPGTKAFEEFQELIQHSSDNFGPLMSVVGKFGVALVRAFNEANPLVEDLIGWLDTLADKFDRFTQGPGFDEWIGNAQSVFGSLSTLLGAVGEALDTLASPEAVERTVALLDSLSELVPVLAEVLDVIGRVNLLGNLVELLNQALQAIEPLIPALAVLADILGGTLSSVIGTL
ncbi:MAG TPA: hypothetical protein VFX15_13685, partial [Actinomycetes bacterium]|nr:hypothetical protein [Actinomycetes bacterium]